MRTTAAKYVAMITKSYPTFGLIEIDWDSPQPSVSLRAHGETGDVVFEVSVPFHELRG